MTSLEDETKTQEEVVLSSGQRGHPLQRVTEVSPSLENEWNCPQPRQYLLSFLLGCANPGGQVNDTLPWKYIVLCSWGPKEIGLGCVATDWWSMLCLKLFLSTRWVGLSPLRTHTGTPALYGMLSYTFSWALNSIFNRKNKEWLAFSIEGSE